MDEAKIAHRDRLYWAQNGKCFYCDDALEVLKVKGKWPPRYATLDRIIPGIRGGRYVTNNLVLACLDCNTRRGNRPADQFLIEMHSRRLTCEAA